MAYFGSIFLANVGGGGGQNCFHGWVPKFCLCVFFGSFLVGEKKHINKLPPKIPGQSREHFVYVFLSLCVFSLPLCDFSYVPFLLPKLELENHSASCSADCVL